jgi:hypothetical protein
VTRVRVDTDALAEWSRTLDRLPCLADQLRSFGSASEPSGMPAAAMLHRTHVDGFRALTEVVESFDCLVEQLRAATMVAGAEYSCVDSRAASIVGSRVR